MLTDLFDEHAIRDLDAKFAGTCQREAFYIPQHGDEDQAYFVGNSLGLQPHAARAAIDDVMFKWQTEAVEGHFNGPTQWLTYHRLVRDQLAALVGALPHEVVAMNTLTVNLHLLMASFYQPVEGRAAILVEKGAFPTDTYAVRSQIEFHGFDASLNLIEVEPDENGWFPTEHIVAAIREHGSQLALVLWPGVQYRTGQVFDMAAIAAAAHEVGAMVGFDCAHSVGNVPMNLHDSDADFAVWCHYKYVNSGPGAVAGAFVHDRHASNPSLPRLAGWWGNRQDVRFLMGPQFEPSNGAEGWQLSNPPVLALAPLRASLELFSSVGIEALRDYSRSMTDYLFTLIDTHFSDHLESVTPRDFKERGCQVSVRILAGRAKGRELFEYLQSRGVLGDWREPDVIRISPAPLYNTHMDILKLARVLREWCDGQG